jgi:hypothetical protein
LLTNVLILKTLYEKPIFVPKLIEFENESMWRNDISSTCRFVN